MAIKKIVLLFIIGAMLSTASAQIRVSDNKKFLTTKDGAPFFWLGDTDWELFHRLTREETEEFLEIRKQQGFNVIQAVALAEFNGIREPNRYGDVPLVNEDPRILAITSGNDPNNASEYDYWDHVDFVIRKAAEKNLYIGLLPTWGDKVAHLWGDGPIIFNAENAEHYARTLATRYKNDWNVLWILGGDRPTNYKATKDGVEKSHDDIAVWRAMAKGIEGVLGKEAFITYHPWGGHSSGQYVHEEPWLDMNSFQSGHGSREAAAWHMVTRDLNLKPQKPTLDMEPCYEDHPVNPWDGKWTRKDRGYFSAYDVRARIYRAVFAGGCGVTYGHHHIWQFLNTELYKPVNTGDTLISWRQAARAEAAQQMRFLKELMLSRPYFNRIHDQSIVMLDKGSNYKDLIMATRDANGSYAMVYLPQNRVVRIDLSKISGVSKNVWWFDPRTGKSQQRQSVQSKGAQMFTPPAGGKDWVLVIDDASKMLMTPGAN